MTAARLLAVVEVPKDDRVACQAPGCNHPMFKRIHVVTENGTLRVIGSECFKKLFGAAHERLSTPTYGSSEGRHLTSEERQLLIENTARLIERFEAERQAELRQAAERSGPLLPPPPPSAPPPTRADIQAAEVQAKQDLRAKYGINPDLPGWRGLVEIRMRELLR